MRKIGLSLAALLLLGACATASQQQLASHDGLERMIRDNYRTYALEQNGLCVRPEIGIISRTEIVEDNDQELVVRVRHTVRGDVDSDPNNIFRPVKSCPTFGERVFTFNKSDDGLKFASMSGPNRPGVTFNFNRTS